MKGNNEGMPRDRRLSKVDARTLSDALIQWMRETGAIGRAVRDPGPEDVKKFAGLVGVHPRTLTRILNSEGHPVENRTLRKIAAAVGVNDDALLDHLDGGYPLPPATRRIADSGEMEEIRERVASMESALHEHSSQLQQVRDLLAALLRPSNEGERRE